MSTVLRLCHSMNHWPKKSGGWPLSPKQSGSLIPQLYFCSRSLIYFLTKTSRPSYNVWFLLRLRDAACPEPPLPVLNQNTWYLNKNIVPVYVNTRTVQYLFWHGHPEIPLLNKTKNEEWHTVEDLVKEYEMWRPSTNHHANCKIWYVNYLLGALYCSVLPGWGALCTSINSGQQSSPPLLLQVNQPGRTDFMSSVCTRMNSL